MKTYFITGTDTDCGKTYVCGALLRYFKARNQSAQALKPLASGTIIRNGKAYSEDVLRLQEDNSYPELPINAWHFKEAIAPHIAAEKEHMTVSAKALAVFCQQAIYQHVDTLLIEGAGGLCVPLNQQETWIDFLQYTQYPIILVVGMRLGCINHALLTDALIRQYELPYAGWIANCLDDNMAYLAENISSLEQRMSAPLLATIPAHQSLTILHDLLLT